ncbi:hypothetical protein BDN72DRAFT_895129 [Pluteus cervinus]|uniref:Uncharacterized protein n=1 Tax=Pluteus cervinus TaxID=181527 RepID=A0ACD3B4W1_9AGAR|nr:hypothetical protein BDN72DRAFT_895129 [Pluteus cervinus]
MPRCKLSFPNTHRDQDRPIRERRRHITTLTLVSLHDNLDFRHWYSVAPRGAFLITHVVHHTAKVYLPPTSTLRGYLPAAFYIDGATSPLFFTLDEATPHDPLPSMELHSLILQLQGYLFRHVLYYFMGYATKSILPETHTARESQASFSPLPGLISLSLG